MKGIVNKNRLLAFIGQTIEHLRDDAGEDWSVILDDIAENLDVSRLDAYELVFEYLMSIDTDPLEELDLDDLKYWFYGEDLIRIFRKYGWFDRYLKDKSAFPRGFNDIEEQGDGERFILVTSDWEEFKDLFEDSGIAGRILSPDWAELYGWFEVDYENDIVDNLDERSIKHIQDYVKEKGLVGKEISSNQYGIDFEGQESVLTEDMVNNIPVLLELIGEDDLFLDLRSELESAYRWAYESAGESDLFDSLVDELTSFFGNRPEWGDGNVLRVDVTNIFYDTLVKYLECNEEMPGYNHSSFIDMLYTYLACASEELDVPNLNYFYPDSTKTEENFNENIISNI
jgi:hypothetical protein